MTFQQKFNTLISKINNNFVWLKNNKQDKLTSGTNIKTINGVSILGSGNMEISGGSSSGVTILPITEADYRDLAVKDPNTLYLITTGFLVWGTSAWGSSLWSLGDE